MGGLSSTAAGRLSLRATAPPLAVTMQCTQLKISAVAPLRGAAKPSARSSVLVAAVASGSSKTDARVAFATAAAAVLLLSSEPAFALVAKKGADAGALALASSLEARTLFRMHARSSPGATRPA